MRISGLIVVSASLALACTGDQSRRVSTPEVAANPAVVTATVSEDGLVTETHADGTTHTRLLSTAVRSAADDPVNRAPVMNVKTTPTADETTTPYPTISGSAPLTVKFNLCQSTDPDQNLEKPELGDHLNWQFNFGDGAPPFNADGTFNPDYEKFCRVEHTYDTGRYTATVSVTDRHLNDQSSDVESLARVSTTFTIAVSGSAPGPSCPFVGVGQSQWLATLVGNDLTCTCPLSGQSINWFTTFVPACFAVGKGPFTTWQNGGKCFCGP
jgi:hypothetical protein